MNWGNTLSPSAIQHLQHHCNAKMSESTSLITLVPSETAAAGRFALPGFHLFTHRLFEHWSTAQNNLEKKEGGGYDPCNQAIRCADLVSSSSTRPSTFHGGMAPQRNEVQVDKDQTRSNDSSLLSPYSSEGYVLHPN